MSPPATDQPEIHDMAVNIARMVRIVIQAFLPPEVVPEAEKRFYLIAVAEIQGGQGRPDHS